MPSSQGSENKPSRLSLRLGALEVALPNTLTLIAASVAMMALVVASISLPQSTQQRTTAETEIRLEVVQYQIAELNKDVESLETQIEALSQVPDESQAAVQLSRLGAIVTELQTQQSKLEEAILDNPAKALAVPLLRRDLDNLEDSQQQNVKALGQAIDRVYDLNKWLLGAMAISIITLALSSFLKGRAEEKE